MRSMQVLDTKNSQAIHSPDIKRRYLTMSMKNSIKNYFNEMMVEYGHIIEMDGRTWHM